MVNIPDCIAWSITQLMTNCIEELKPQTEEMYNYGLCSASKDIIHNNMMKRLVILEKISKIHPILCSYYDKDNFMWKENAPEYKDALADYKKRIDEFVTWLRSLKGHKTEIRNIHDWTY